MRLKLSPNPLAAGGTFRQEFFPAESCICIRGRNASSTANILMWVDVDRPVVHVQVGADRPVTVEASFETWRHIQRPIDWRNWKRHGTIDLPGAENRPVGEHGVLRLAARDNVSPA